MKRFIWLQGISSAYVITPNSMKAPFWKANSRSAGQEMFQVLLNSEPHSCLHKRSPFNPIWRQLNAVRTMTSICLNILTRLFYFIYFSYVSCVLYATPLSHSLIWWYSYFVKFSAVSILTIQLPKTMKDKLHEYLAGIRRGLLQVSSQNLHRGAEKTSASIGVVLAKIRSEHLPNTVTKYLSSQI